MARLRRQRTVRTDDWWDAFAARIRQQGGMTYRVDGFQEIVDAVRRGHAVLVRRTRVEVADGIVVFDTAAPGDDGVAAILSFDIGTARFVLQDPADPHAQVALTPRRLQRYVDAPDRSCGLALGA